MKNNIFDLTGQVALVAGGSSGLGLQFAKAMANAGANVAIVARRTDRLEKNAKEIAAKLQDKKITVLAKAGQNGRLFGTVTAKEISAAIKHELGCDVDKKKISVNLKIEGFGDFSAEARLYAGVTAKFTVSVAEG